MTVAASEITDMKEVRQLTSPLFSQKREVSSNPSGEAPGNRSEVLSHFQVLKDPCREEDGIKISNVCRFCPKRETFMPNFRRKLKEFFMEKVQKWTEEIGNNTLNLRDWSSIRRINGLIGLVVKRSVSLENQM